MGKKKRTKSLGRLLIDLTPLLDVIFIVLIVVLAGRDSYSAAAEEKMLMAEEYTKEADQKLNEMEAKVDTYLDQMNTYNVLNEYFNVVTVYSAYSPENRRLRTIYVMINTDEPVMLSLTPSTSEKWDECRDIVEEVIKKDLKKPVILSINMNNEGKMLYRDEVKINEIFMELVNKYDNVSVKKAS